MRIILPLFLIIMLLPLPLRAEYFFRGRVIDVDREKGEITLAAFDCPGCPSQGTGAEPQQTEPPGPAQEKIYIVSSDFIPPCAAPDRIIQVWGELSAEDANRVQASRITGPGWRHGQDSTGVRSRLRKRCFMKTPQLPGPPAAP